MNTLFQDQVAWALSICDAIQENCGIEVVVAGGFVRDIAAGIRPTDIDFWVINGHMTESTYTDLKMMLEQLAPLGKSFYTKFGSYNDLAGDEIDGNPYAEMRSIKALLQGTIPDWTGLDTIEVDVIDLTDAAETPEDLVNEFDYNINQGFIQAQGDTARIIIPDLSKLEFINDEPARRTEKRAIHMEEVFTEIQEALCKTSTLH